MMQTAESCCKCLGEEVKDRFPLAVFGQVEGSLLNLVVMVCGYAEGVKYGGVEIGYRYRVLGYQ